MKTLKTVFAAVTFLLVASCSSNDDTTPEDPEVFPQEITPVLIADWFFIENPDSLPDIALEEGGLENFIIDNEADWTNFLTTMGTATAQFSETVIDFDEYQIIASFKRCIHPYQDVKIISVTENLENLVIDILYVETPWDSCFGFIGESYLQYYIIKIPKSPKPIFFTSSIVIPACPEGNLGVGIKKETPIGEVFATLGNLDFEIKQVHDFSYYFNNVTPDQVENQVEELVDLFNQKPYINISAYDRAKPEKMYYQTEYNRIRISLTLFNMTPANQADFVNLISTLGLEDTHNLNRTLYIEVPEGTEESWITQMETYPFVVWAAETGM